jgi:hypothetical protein
MNAGRSSGAATALTVAPASKASGIVRPSKAARRRERQRKHADGLAVGEREALELESHLRRLPGSFVPAPAPRARHHHFPDRDGRSVHEQVNEHVSSEIARMRQEIDARAGRLALSLTAESTIAELRRGRPVRTPAHSRIQLSAGGRK